MIKSADIERWVAGLTAEQMRPLIIELVDIAMEAECVGVQDGLAPYWKNTGEPLIEGQKSFED